MIGGATVVDSPILRRPDLLRSMVAFWQNHPSLSYLFSGMYVGPTSQYPRVDEARMDALYELEVAFRHLPSSDCPSFIVDGLFRNLLADVTGNTHRAEFCIDKLFPPEGLGLQLGLLELRAFEMPPHVQHGASADAAYPRIGLRVLESAVRRKPRPLGHDASRPFYAAPFCQAGLFRGARSVAAIRASTLKRSGLLRTSNFAFRRSGRSLQMESNSSCAEHSNRGTCSLKRLFSAGRFATSTHRLSGCK